MTCDDIFDVLTRGPFPSGAADDEVVERHLAACAGCRRLAEALRPAVELLQEAIVPEESHGLPGYRGQVAWSESEWPFEYEEAAPAARSARAPSPVRPFVIPAANLLRFAAAVLVGVTAAAGWHGLAALRAIPANGQPPVRASDTAGSNVSGGNPARLPSVTDRPDRGWLAAQVLPAVCRDGAARPRQGDNAHDPRQAAFQVAALDSSDLNCCTDCHSSATSGRLAPEARTLVARACLACH
ncbi:MAG: hypothetical protein HYX69_12055 [Planctomycetia bacterium]|nr:hypothetical protein [Planctomycetia bacterium]